MKNGYLFYANNVFAIFTSKEFKGWGRKRTGRFALWCQKTFAGKLTLLEDGFISTVGSNLDDVFSTIKDDIGIYYDATKPSRLENILNTYDFSSDDGLMTEARNTIAFIKKYQISKYNNTLDIDRNFEKRYKITDQYMSSDKILIVAQTSGDMSLKYGLADMFSTDDMIQAAISENPDATVYLKIHPDVITGKKESDIDIEKVKKHCIIIEENVNPLALLSYFTKVYTKTSQMGFEALLLGKVCVCFGMPFYAGWGMTDDRVLCKRRQRKLNMDEVFAGAYILYAEYINPYTQCTSDITTTIKEIRNLKKIQIVQTKVKAYFFGFSRWKHTFIRPFFLELEDKNKIFINPIFGKRHLDMALKRGLSKESRIYIWGRKYFPDVEQYAKDNTVEVFRVEDGFIRSVGLGSDLTQAYSQVVDSRGIYFDPTQESDLEFILNNYDFESDLDLMQRAKRVHQIILEKKLSKYNIDSEKVLRFPKEKRIILVPGQVEDDASIEFGAKGMTNLSVLKGVREKNLLAYIIFKPHPDVLTGNRIGHIEEKLALEYCNEIVQNVSLDSVLAQVDEVHTMTSLVGFEAMLREIDVYTYGLPFYAGWGLSKDKRICARRTVKLKLHELIAGALILYPRYLDPKSKSLCTVETFLDALDVQREDYLKSKSYMTKIKIRNLLNRKGQVVLSFFKEM